MWRTRASEFFAFPAALAAAALVASVGLVAPVAHALSNNGKKTVAEVAAVPDDMALIPAGPYRPLYADSEADRAAVHNNGQGGKGGVGGGEWVEEFLLDRRAASNGEFLKFVRAAPKWRKSRAPKIFVDENYLAHWRGDEDLGEVDPDAPVVNVSWFAAAAYCRAQGKTLPAVAQWERAAAASETAEDGAADPDFARRILEWYSAPADRPPPAAAGFENLYGVRDMHGLIWEWTLDFNSELVTGESRADTGLSRQLFCGAASIGAADPRDYAAFMRRAFRSSLEGRYAVGALGFRCAAPPTFAAKQP